MQFYLTLSPEYNIMSEPSSENNLVRYYCTAGNGMERFLMNEVKNKLEAEDVCQFPGKVIFSSSVKINRVTEVKAAERLFLLLKQDSPVQLPANINPAKAASVLRSRLVGDRVQWTSALMTWSRLQGELADRGAAVNASRKRIERGRIENQKEEEEKCDFDASSSKEEQPREGSGNESFSSGDLNGVQSPEQKRNRETKKEISEGVRHFKDIKEGEMIRKKRKRDDQKEDGERCDFQNYSEKNEENLEMSTAEKKNEAEELSGLRKVGKNVLLNMDFLGKKDAISYVDHNTESSSKKKESTVQEFSLENVKSTERRDTTLSRMKPEAASVPVSFRISCKCSGQLSRYFSVQEVSRIFGVGLSRMLGWKVDLKNPQMEINVHLSDDHCLLGIPLTRLPMATRSYIKTTGLRSTVAWAMISLADVQPGFCVVDPMCGVGTILIEAAQEYKAAHFLGMDNDDGQLLKANENVEFAGLGNRIHLLKASSMALPLSSAAVDAVVCDLPFGRKFGTKTNMTANLPLILTEMERVLRPGGSLVLLLSPQLSCLLKKLLAQKETGQMPNQETKPSFGVHDCQTHCPSSMRQQTFQVHQGVNSLTSQETQLNSRIQGGQPPLSSLEHQSTYRVSLGLIDGLMHKYVKICT